MPADELRQFAGDVVAAARHYGARVLVNGPLELATESGADGVHLTSAQLMSCQRRPAVSWCAASCHDAGELQRAHELGLDFVVLGPVAATPSHPQATILGWPRFTQLVRNYPLPVYALGGMQVANIESAWRCGAHGVAMMRGTWIR